MALVGETGAGKSSIVKLLARFHDPTSGSVTVDGIDLRDIDLTEYRQQLGVVPQEPFLFTGIVRDNIAYGRPEATDAVVEAAARAVGAHSFIASLPDGYRTAISERGRSLSAGQRQLIALARAQLVDPAVLLLDEATANLDLNAEAKVRDCDGGRGEFAHHDPCRASPADGPRRRSHHRDGRRPRGGTGRPRCSARCGGKVRSDVAGPPRPRHQRP